MVDISERSLEETIERALLAGGPDAPVEAATEVRERPITDEPWPGMVLDFTNAADTNLKFYKRVNDDEAFARHFLDWLFERVRTRAGG